MCSRGSSIPWRMSTPNTQNCAKNTPPPPHTHSTSSFETGTRPGGRVSPQTSPEGDEQLTVDVLDEAGGAGHIVHFELR